MNSKFLKRFAFALSENKLVAFVHELKSESYSQLEIYELFSQFHKYLVTQGLQERDSDQVFDVMDRICGWCSDEARLFSEYLTNDAIEAYRKGSQQKST